LGNAERDVASALAVDPTNSTALATKAMIAVWRKDYKTGLDLVDQVLARDPTNSYARTLQGQLLKRQGNQSDAMRALNEAVSRAPGDVSHLLDRASAHLQAKEFEAAEKDVVAALEIAPTDLRALQARSSIAVARGDYTGAVNALTSVLKASPSNGPALEARAEVYRQMRQYDTALADTDAALKIGFVSPSLRLLRINIRLQQGNLPAVAAEIEELVKENPTSDFAWVVAGKTYAAIGMRQKAMDSFDRAIAIKPYSYIYINRSQARPYSDMAGKLADLDAALKLEPDQEDAMAEKARLLSKQGKHAEAIDLYDRAIKTALDGSYLKLGRAIALQRAGRLVEAKQAFDAERARSKTAGDFSRLCRTKAANDVLLQSALEDCRDAIRMDPNYWTANDGLGMVLLKLGKLKEALASYDKAVAHQSGADAYMGRAFVYARMGDSQHARADADQARKLRPDIDSEFAEYGLTFDGNAAAKPGK
jgi:tetratricopeptide (TPR) repeat protein